MMEDWDDQRKFAKDSVPHRDIIPAAPFVFAL
jgi:hypothetical protein